MSSSIEILNCDYLAEDEIQVFEDSAYQDFSHIFVAQEKMAL